MPENLHLQKFLSGSMLLLFFGLSLFSFEGALLCFGKDGHVAIEFVGACSGADFGSQVAEAGEDTCGPCKDIQIQSSPAHTNRTFHSIWTQKLPLESSALITPSLSLKEQSDGQISHPEKPPHKTLASLNSVVLLI